MAKRLYVDGVNCSRLILDTLVTSTLSTLRSTLNRKLSYVLVKEDNSNYSITGAADSAVFEEGEHFTEAEERVILRSPTSPLFG